MENNTVVVDYFSDIPILNVMNVKGYAIDNFNNSGKIRVFFSAKDIAIGGGLTYIANRNYKYKKFIATSCDNSENTRFLKPENLDKIIATSGDNFNMNNEKFTATSCGNSNMNNMDFSATCGGKNYNCEALSLANFHETHRRFSEMGAEQLKNNFDREFNQFMNRLRVD